MDRLSSLPDVCLLTILDNIPLHELYYNVCLVSKRFAALQLAACQRRKTLVLVTDLHYINSAHDLRFGFEMFDSAVQPDGITPFRGVNYKKMYRNSALQFDFQHESLQDCDRLADYFTNIRTLKIVQYDLPLADLFKVQLILLRLAFKIRKLKLWIWLEDEPINDFEPNAELNPLVKYHLNSLMGVINQLMVPRLKHLELNLQMPRAFTGVVNLDLRILKQLEYFIYRSYGLKTGANLERGADDDDDDDFNGRMVDRFDNNEPLCELEQYGSGNSALKEVILLNFNDLDRLLGIETDLARKFLELNVDDWLYPRDMFSINLFCSKFTSLTVLSIRLGKIALDRMVRPLSNLTQLTHFAVHVHPAVPNSIRTEEEDEDFPRLRTVIALSLFLESTSHLDLATLELPFIFPNVQVMLLRYNCAGCTVCQIGPYEAEDLNRMDGYGDPIIEQIKECMRVGRLPLIGFEKLRMLLVNDKPTEMTEYEDDPLTREMMMAGK